MRVVAKYPPKTMRRWTWHIARNLNLRMYHAVYLGTHLEFWQLLTSWQWSSGALRVASHTYSAEESCRHMFSVCHLYTN
jgi:hypothetical protein